MTRTSSSEDISEQQNAPKYFDHRDVHKAALTMSLHRQGDLVCSLVDQCCVGEIKIMLLEIDQPLRLVPGEPHASIVASV